MERCCPAWRCARFCVDGRGESHTYTRTLVTGKGLAYIQKRLQNQNNFMQEATA